MARPRFLRLALLQLFQAVLPWRWLLLVPALGLLASFVAEMSRFDSGQPGLREINLWDLLPAVLSYRHGLLWGFALGFTLVAGDALARARVSGMAALSLVRVPSRMRWWVGRLASVGLEAAGYVAVCSLTILLMGAWMLPLAPGLSEAAVIEAGSHALYLRWPSLSLPVFYTVIAARTALGLWLVGGLLELVSLVTRRPAAPFFCTMTWIVLSLSAFHRLEGPARWLDLARVLSYEEHLAPGGSSFGTFLLGWAVVMGVVVLAGGWKLRQMDVT